MNDEAPLAPEPPLPILLAREDPMLARDEMNLAENPFAWLTDRPDPAVKTLHFRYPLKGKEAVWTITGSDQYGLPLPGDEDILLILTQMTRERGLADRVLPFSRREILRRLKGDEAKLGGKDYQRIQEALFRIQGTRITATHWYNNQLKTHVHYAGGIIEDVIIVDETAGRRSSPSTPLSYIVWNEQFFNSLKSGYVKAIDLKRYLSLGRPITKKLYRFLDKKFYDRKPRFEMNLRVLAHEHLGIQRSYKYDADVKKALKPAHDDLVRIGFLSGVDYRRTSEGWIVIYHRGDLEEAPAGETSAPHPEIPAPALQEALIEAGISRAVAERLLQQHPEEKIREKLEFVNYRAAKNPGAYLRTAIEEDWDLYEIIQKAREAEEQKRQQREAREERAAAKEAETRRRRAQQTMLAERLAEKSATEREQLQAVAEVQARANHPAAAKAYDRGKGARAWKKLVETELERIVLGGGTPGEGVSAED